MTDHLLWWMHGPRENEWYAVGDSGFILHQVNGDRLDESVPTSATLYGVWATDDQVIAVGGDVRAAPQTGEIWIREDGEWELFRDELPGPLFKVWRNWIVGDGQAYTLENGTLVDRRTPPVNDETRLLTVVGRDANDVWAVGGRVNPVLLHWQDGVWTDVEVDPFCAVQPLNGVWTAPNESIFFAGFFGSVGSYDGTTWNCPEDPVTMDDLHAVFPHRDEVLWLGGNLFSQQDNYGVAARVRRD